jgi:twitching motility protein PilJ
MEATGQAPVADSGTSGAEPLSFDHGLARIREGIEKAKQLEKEFCRVERVARTFLASVNGSAFATRTELAPAEVLTKLPAVLDRLRTTAAAIHKDASSLDELNERVASGAADQSDAVARTASAVEALSEKIDRISVNADEAAKACEHVRDEARKGLEQVHTVIEGMDRLLAQIEASGRKTRRLEDRSSEIGVIVEMIRGISSRTDMLALNATIESVRAGEHGRGFAVVADEIRKLSERTATATREIGTIVEAIQVDTHESITALSQSQSDMQRESERIRGTGSALELISQVAERSARLVEGISRSTNDQVVATQDLVRAMQRISEVTHQTLERTNHSRTSLKGLVQACEPWQQLASAPSSPESSPGSAVAPTPSRSQPPSSLANPLTRRKRELTGSEITR